MQRRDFFEKAGIAGLGLGLGSIIKIGSRSWLRSIEKSDKVKNIIFLVSDGMSSGTLQMADLLRQRRDGISSHWLNLYRQNKVNRALMDMASLNSAITDSAAASSSWGSGYRVNNGALNVGPNGEEYTPILQKFKSAGKSVGCVTTVPITHATPAGFCINSKTRGSMAEIALKYLDLRFDIMMGGGTDQFSKTGRKDKRDLFQDFRDAGYHVATKKSEIPTTSDNKPIIGVFHDSGLPYTVDHMSDQDYRRDIPTLAEMTETALKKLSKNPQGFVLQVEGGKVDWAAHGNDTAGLLLDQLAFDDVIPLAIRFADENPGTLVIITTDHGNANPALVYGKNADKNFDRIQSFTQSNNWILQGIDNTYTAQMIIDRIASANGFQISNEEALSILAHYKELDGKGEYNDYKLPYQLLAQIQSNHTSVHWAANEHTGDYVEIAMYGTGQHLLPTFLNNVDLHNFMLDVCGVTG